MGFQTITYHILRTMNKRRKLLILGYITAALCITALQETAKAVPTDWRVVDASMTQLLNSGWQISGYSSNRAAVGGAGSANNYDTSDFTYLLIKNGRYITCILENPRSPMAKVSVCRSLN